MSGNNADMLGGISNDRKGTNEKLSGYLPRNLDINETVLSRQVRAELQVQRVVHNSVLPCEMEDERLCGNE